jgi:hypothetical protein
VDNGFFNRKNILAKHGAKDIQVLHYGIWPWRRILNGTCISISNLPENIVWQTHKDDLRPEARGPLKSGTWGGRPTCHPQTPALNGNVYYHKSNYCTNCAHCRIFYYVKYVVLKGSHTYTRSLTELRVTFTHYIKLCRRMFGMCWRSNTMDPAFQISIS